METAEFKRLMKSGKGVQQGRKAEAVRGVISLFNSYKPGR